MNAPAENGELLRVENLQTHFFTDGGVARAVDGVSFRVDPAHTLGLVGESGCGKSVTALSILRLVPDPPGRIVGGEIWFEDRDLLRLPIPEMRKIRGNDISMIFQEPMTALNPVFTVGYQIAETLRTHRKLSKKEALDESVGMMELVRIPSASRRASEYPHQMSGGMRQRVMIAMAMACDPKVLIADEPTTALDVTVQAQILGLMDRLRHEKGTGIILITHDLAVIAEVADRVAVMYAGQIVEHSTVEEIFEEPLHPYTVCLLRSIPRIEEESSKKRLPAIEGTVPSPADFPPGCRFHPRCPRRFEPCDKREPAPYRVRGRMVRCFLYEEQAEGTEET